MKISLVLIALLLPIRSGIALMNGVPSRTCQAQTNTFAVSCPPSWYVLETDAMTIDLLSFPPSERLEGVVIKKGGAEITIDLATSSTPDLRTWIASDKKLFDTNKPITMRLSETACLESQAVNATIAMGPQTVERDVSIYCGTQKHLYRLRLRGWQTDPKWPSYLQALMEVFRSFKEVPATR